MGTKLAIVLMFLFSLGLTGCATLAASPEVQEARMRLSEHKTVMISVDRATHGNSSQLYRHTEQALRSFGWRIAEPLAGPTQHDSMGMFVVHVSERLTTRTVYCDPWRYDARCRIYSRFGSVPYGAWPDPFWRYDPRFGSSAFPRSWLSEDVVTLTWVLQSPEGQVIWRRSVEGYDRLSYEQSRLLARQLQAWISVAPR